MSIYFEIVLVNNVIWIILNTFWWVKTNYSELFSPSDYKTHLMLYLHFFVKIFILIKFYLSSFMSSNACDLAGMINWNMPEIHWASLFIMMVECNSNILPLTLLLYSTNLSLRAFITFTLYYVHCCYAAKW